MSPTNQRAVRWCIASIATIAIMPFACAAPTSKTTDAAKNVPQTVTSPLGKRLTLKFHDEFNPVKDTDGKPYVDRSKWQTTFWQGSSERTLLGNIEAQYYTDKDYAGKDNIPVEKRPNPFSFEKPGILTISATRVPESLWANYWMGTERCYSSGLLISDRRFTFKYGYVEGRFKLPNNRGAWPAFWLLGDDPSKPNQDIAHEWGPEVDVFEFFGHRPTKHSAGIVTRKEDSPITFRFGYNEVGVDLTKDYHVWGMEWDKDRVVFTLDGKIWAKGNTPESLNRPMYLLINLAVGGKWYMEEMNANKTPYIPWEVDVAGMPWKMECDYVRVYQ